MRVRFMSRDPVVRVKKEWKSGKGEKEPVGINQLETDRLNI